MLDLIRWVVAEEFPGGRGGPMPGGELGGFGDGGGAAGATMGPRTGTPDQVFDANKYRYIQRTDQVRRIPVAVVLIVDQMFMQDVLVEYANSPLRIQVTQFHWQRYRAGSTSSGGSVPGGMDPGLGGGRGEEGFGGFGVPSGFATSTDEQASSGLVELSLYGVVNLYNQYEDSVPVMR